MLGWLGMRELLVIVGVAVVIFGAGRIPDIAKSLGKGIKEFKKAGREIASDLEEDAKGEPKDG